MLTLADILAADPSESDADVADAYNAQLPVYRRVPTAEVRDLLTARRLNAPLRFARDNPDLPVELRGGVIEFLATLNGFEHLDATDDRNRTDALMVAGGLAQAGVITPDDAAAAAIERAYTSAQSVADPADRDAVRAALLAGFDAAWPGAD